VEERGREGVREGRGEGGARTEACSCWRQRMIGGAIQCPRRPPVGVGREGGREGRSEPARGGGREEKNPTLQEQGQKVNEM